MENTLITMDNMPLKKFHYKLAAYTVGGMLIDGYILGIIEFALVLIVPYMNMNPVWQGLIASSPLMGILVGSLIFGRISDKIGRQLIYTWHFIILIICSFLQFFVNTPESLFALRLILGISIGAEYAIGPSLLAEFLPIKLRGPLLSSLTIAWTLGYLCATFLSYYLKDMGAESWRWMLSSSGVLGIIIMFFRAGAPESPRWLICHGQIEKAKEIVNKYFGPEVSIENLIAESKSTTKELGYKFLFNKQMWKRTAFTSIFYFCQVMPFFAMVTFMPTVFNTLGVKNAFSGTLVFNGFLLFGAIVGVIIIDKISRRKLLIGTFILSGIPLLLLGLVANVSSTVVVICFCTFVFFGVIGGQLTYVYPPEVFPTELRTSGYGFATAISRVGAASGTFLLPVLMSSFGINKALIMSAAVIAFGALVSFAWAPETLKKSLSATASISDSL